MRILFVEGDPMQGIAAHFSGSLQAAFWFVAVSMLLSGVFSGCLVKKRTVESVSLSGGFWHEAEVGTSILTSRNLPLVNVSNWDTTALRDSPLSGSSTPPFK
jgi:hypothetical protein